MNDNKFIKIIFYVFLSDTFFKKVIFCFTLPKSFLFLIRLMNRFIYISKKIKKKIIRLKKSYKNKQFQANLLFIIIFVYFNQIQINPLNHFPQKFSLIFN